MIDLLELHHKYPIGCSRILAYFDKYNDVFVSYYDKQEAMDIIFNNNLSEKVIDILDFFDSIGCQFFVTGNLQERFSFQCGYGYMWFSGSNFNSRSEAYKRVIQNIIYCIDDKLVKDSKWLFNLIEKN